MFALRAVVYIGQRLKFEWILLRANKNWLKINAENAESATADSF